MHDDVDEPLQPLAVPVRILAGGVIIRVSRGLHAFGEWTAERAEDVARLASRVLPGLDEPDHHGAAIERISGIPMHEVRAMLSDEERVDAVLDAAGASAWMDDRRDSIRCAAIDALALLSDDPGRRVADTVAEVAGRYPLAGIGDVTGIVRAVIDSHAHDDEDPIAIAAARRGVSSSRIRAVVERRTGRRDTPRNGG